MTKSSDFVARVGGIRKVDPGRARFSFPTRTLGQTIGPVCVGCAHPTCRTGRAQSLPRLGGHRSEYACEHAQAAAIQASNPHTVVWWGEATQSFWAAVNGGLQEAEDVDALLLAVWPGPDPAAGTERTPAPEVERRPAPMPAAVPAPASDSVRVPVPASTSASVPTVATGPVSAPLRTTAVGAAETNHVPVQMSPWAAPVGRTLAERPRALRPRPPSSPYPAPPPSPIPRPRPHPETPHRALTRR